MSLLLFVLAAGVQPPETPPAVQTIKEGEQYIMRSLDGAKPLYTYDRDEPGKSNCVDRCLAAWPALVAPANAKPVGKWSVIRRSDGTSQWAFEKKPVYTFVRDSNGTATGDGMGGSWHLLPSTAAE